MSKVTGEKLTELCAKNGVHVKIKKNKKVEKTELNITSKGDENKHDEKSTLSNGNCEHRTEEDSCYKSGLIAENPSPSNSASCNKSGLIAENLNLSNSASCYKSGLIAENPCPSNSASCYKSGLIAENLCPSNSVSCNKGGLSAENPCPSNSANCNKGGLSAENPCPSNSSNGAGEAKDSLRDTINDLKTKLNLEPDQTPSIGDDIQFVSYKSELQMGPIMKLIQKDLSEPYSIYTYRYFIHNWPKLCFLAMHYDQCIGAIVCKLDLHRNVVKRGYIAMLAVDEKFRKRKVGSRLVRMAIQAMINDNADEVVLETEITNRPALRLYENLGFVRDKRLFRYYLNGVDALRLKLWLR